MTQTSLWQDNKQHTTFAEICNALYERELRLLASADIAIHLKHVEVTTGMADQDVSLAISPKVTYAFH